MGLPRLSRHEAAFVLGVPLAWAVLLLFHPGGEGDQIYADLNGDGTRMLVVHVGMMIFVPLMALAIALLLRGIESTAARVSRVALITFVVFYVAWESLQGIANGILVDQVSTLPAADRGLGATLIQSFAESPLVRDLGVFAAIGSVALVIATVAAGIALRDVGAPRWTPAALGLSGFLITAHPPPFGPTGLLLFVVVTVLVIRRPTAARGAVRQPEVDLVIRRPTAARGAVRQPEVDPASVGRTAFSHVESAFLIGVPLAWAIVLAFHPTGEGENFYPIVRDEVTTWEVVHIGSMVFVPLMAGVVLLLLRGVDGAPAAVSRIAAALFAVVYMAWEVVIGIGTGVLVDDVNQLNSSEQPVGASLVEKFTDSGLVRGLELVGTGAWIVAMIGAGTALVRERGVSRMVLVLLVLSALPTAWHVAPFGQVGLALFIAAMMLVLWGRSSGAVRVRRGQPAAA
jgi:hypothetical protein